MREGAALQPPASLLRQEKIHIGRPRTAGASAVKFLQKTEKDAHIAAVGVVRGAREPAFGEQTIRPFPGKIPEPVRWRQRFGWHVCLLPASYGA